MSQAEQIAEQAYKKAVELYTSWNKAYGEDEIYFDRETGEAHDGDTDELIPGPVTTKAEIEHKEENIYVCHMAANETNSGREEDRILRIKLRADDYVDEGYSIILSMMDRSGPIDDMVTTVDRSTFMDDIMELLHYTTNLEIEGFKGPKDIPQTTQVTASSGSKSPVKDMSAKIFIPNINKLSYSPTLIEYEEENTVEHYETDKTLFDYLEDAGFDYLLPAQESVRDDYVPDDIDYLYTEDYETDDADEFEDQGPYLAYDGIHTLDDDEYGEQKDTEFFYRLKETFGCPEISDTELTHSTPWKLLGITAHQFHKINAMDLTDLNFHLFAEQMQNEVVRSTIPDAESRIRYAILYANADLWGAGLNQKDDIRYLLKLATGRSLNAAIQLVQLYQDYLHSRNSAITYNDEYIQDQEAPEHPYYEYPRYPKPGAIRDLHDKAARDAVSLSDVRGAAENELLDKEITEVIRTPEYRRFLYKGRDYSVIAAESIKDLKYEGEVLQHCIGTYGHKFATRQSMIYFIRKNTEIDQPFYSAEILQHPHHYELSQLYTYRDGTDKTDDFRDFIKEWIAVKKLRTGCEI